MTPGAVDTEVVVELAPGIEVVSIITKQSAEKLGLNPGAKTSAIIRCADFIDANHHIGRFLMSVPLVL